MIAWRPLYRHCHIFYRSQLHSTPRKMYHKFHIPLLCFRLVCHIKQLTLKNYNCLVKHFHYLPTLRLVLNSVIVHSMTQSTFIANPSTEALYSFWESFISITVFPLYDLPVTTCEESCSKNHIIRRIELSKQSLSRTLTRSGFLPVDIPKTIFYD